MTPRNLPPVDDFFDPADRRRRYFDPALGCHVIQVFQGDYYVTSRGDEVLTTILGSCISACIRNPMTGFGGMNHFLLPEPVQKVDVGVSLRYGSHAMESLIQEILSHGGSRDQLEIKLFGGGNVMAGMAGVGHKNADFIEGYLERAGLEPAGCHLRGDSPRRVQYFPRSGRARMRELPPTIAAAVGTSETGRGFRVHAGPRPGSVELFD